jgi:hypothetical protein
MERKHKKSSKSNKIKGSTKARHHRNRDSYDIYGKIDVYNVYDDSSQINHNSKQHQPKGNACTYEENSAPNRGNYAPCSLNAMIGNGNFDAHLYTKPEVPRTAAELEGHFDARNFMNPNLKCVRTAEDLKGIGCEAEESNQRNYQDYQDYQGYRCRDNRQSKLKGCKPKHKPKPKPKPAEVCTDNRINCIYNDNDCENRDTDSIINERERIHKLNRELATSERAFLLGKGLYAPHKGLYMNQ